MSAFPQSSRSINPFDLGGEAPQTQTQTVCYSLLLNYFIACATDRLGPIGFKDSKNIMTVYNGGMLVLCIYIEIKSCCKI